MCKLASDQRNTVYILSELPKEFLSIWLSDIPNLGLACEAGFLYRVNNNCEFNIEPNRDRSASLI